MAILSYPRGGAYFDTAEKAMAKGMATPEALLPTTADKNRSKAGLWQNK
jgi:hypothetical protein